MPGGRPTSYDPAFCEQAVEFIGQGYSTTAFAGHIGVGRTTLYRWIEEHEEFRHAVKAGQAAGAEWWENQLRKIGKTGGETGQATAVIFALKNRAADDWRDAKAVEHTGEGGGPIQVQSVVRKVVDPL